MGYSTKFTGSLKFAHNITVKEIAALKAMECIDRREIVPAPKGEWYYLDLEANDELDGIKWSGAEKSYDMVGQVNYVIDKMKKDWPKFSLSGEMAAQGEDADDRWILRIVNGRAVKIEDPPSGRKVECPECECNFYV